MDWRPSGRVNPTAMSEAETALQPDLPAEPAGHLIETGPSVPEAGGILTVNLAAIAANWQELGRRAMPSECAAVIKADGYGCGIEPVARALKGAGCKTFFVADLGEARRVRTVAPDAAIYVLNGLLPGTAAAFPDIRARPVIGSLVELAEWDAFCSANQWHGGAALHVDTGMNRLGISADEAAALAPRIRAENHGITLLMSHLVCADQPDHPLNERQMKLIPRSAPSLPRHSRLARQFIWHISRQWRPLRHGAPRRRAFRGQSDARPPQSNAPGH